MEQREVLKSH